MERRWLLCDSKSRVLKEVGVCERVRGTGSVPGAAGGHGGWKGEKGGEIVHRPHLVWTWIWTPRNVGG